MDWILVAVLAVAFSGAVLGLIPRTGANESKMKKIVFGVWIAWVAGWFWLTPPLSSWLGMIWLAGLIVLGLVLATLDVEAYRKRKDEREALKSMRTIVLPILGP